MDLLCDNLVEEILLRLPLKYLHRLGAVSRRYNALVLGPGFADRYWRSLGPHLSGVFLQSETLIRPWGKRPCFLTAPGSRRPSTAESVFASDLGFLPQIQTGHVEREKMIFIVHSAAGLLLCSRGSEKQVHYFVCNPVTWQCVALPELPWPIEYHSGLLSVAYNAYGNIERFQVVLVDHPQHWQDHDGCIDTRVFLSDTGQWKAMKLHQPPSAPSIEVDAWCSTFLGQSGTAYWLSDEHRLIAYDSFYCSVHELTLPNRVGADGPRNRCIGERLRGGLRYAHFNFPVFEVMDLMISQETQVCRFYGWNPVHRIDVMELTLLNPEAEAFMCNTTGVNTEGINNLAKRNRLFEVIGIHPTDDIVYFDVASTVAAYSLDQRTIRFQSPRQCFSMDVFPYVHPAHPVLIPEIKQLITSAV